jgi:hypothetical protein
MKTVASGEKNFEIWGGGGWGVEGVLGTFRKPAISLEAGGEWVEGYFGKRVTKSLAGGCLDMR